MTTYRHATLTSSYKAFGW